MITAKTVWRCNMQHFDLAGEEELRFLHRRMDINRMRERNKKRSTAWVMLGLLAMTVWAVWMAVR